METKTSFSVGGGMSLTNVIKPRPQTAAISKKKGLRVKGVAFSSPVCTSAMNPF